MASFVPSFNCPSVHQTHQAKARGPASFRIQCISAQTTAVIDSCPTYFDATITSRYAKTYFETTLPTEALLTGEEATIAAAAAEAIVLARAAVKVARDAAQMKGNDAPVKAVRSENFPSEADKILLERVRLEEMESLIIENNSDAPETILQDKCIPGLLQNSPDPQQTQDSKCTAVRSKRQTERRVRRAMAVMKAANRVVSVKSGSSSKKKRSVMQEVDYSDPLRNLRGAANSSRLLTVSEELEMSEGIQELMKLERLQEEISERNGSAPTFAQWATAAGVDPRTLRKRLNYGKNCKDRMIKSNIRLVISIAKNFQGAGMSLQDLVQEGCRGLVKGAEKFDASKGFKFSTYAHWWIKQAVRRSLSDQSRTIRLPFHMVEATYRVREARKQLYSENGRHPDNEEIAEAAGLTMKRLTAVMLIPKAPRSLDQKIGIDQSLKPSEVTADPEAQTSEEILVRQILMRELNKVLDSLSPREKQVIKQRFGLGDGRIKTLQEIGESMGVSRERIRQIESFAFRKLKNKKRTKNLRQHFIT